MESGAEPDRPPVLLVEDNEINQTVAAAMLRGAGYQVDVVDDGRAALDAVERKSYAAVLMDCQMPVMDGYAATAELRRREDGEEHVPIIALTASVAESERQRCLAAGMDDFLAKPVKAEELAATLDRLIGPRLLDGAAVRRLRAAVASEELVERIYDLFFAQASRHLETIRSAIAAGDAGAATRAAHALKGSAATDGALRISRLAEAVEHGELDSAAELDDAFERTRAACGERYLR